jgi:hypothetical protein
MAVETEIQLALMEGSFEFVEAKIRRDADVG